MLGCSNISTLITLDVFLLEMEGFLGVSRFKSPKTGRFPLSCLVFGGVYTSISLLSFSQKEMVGLLVEEKTSKVGLGLYVSDISKKQRN